MAKSRGSKKLTKFTLFLTMFILAAVILSATVSAATPKVGDVLGNVVYSDITAYINGQAIPTSVIQGQTLVIVEDLARYGFDVVWNGSAKTLKVELVAGKKIDPIKVEKDTVNKPGTFKQQYFYTDIKTYLSGKEVPSYAVNGKTLINFELLGAYGNLDWNEQLKEIRLQTSAAGPKVGDVMGNVLYSDITAYINGQQIPTSVIQGQTLVIVEDLARYGFDVVWNGSAKTLKVEFDKTKRFDPIAISSADAGKVGAIKGQYFYTDIKTYLSGQVIESFAVNGKTMINFELLKKYGEINWNNTSKKLSLTVENNAVDIKSIDVNGSDTASTTQLIITLNRSVPGLAAADFTVTGAAKGSLTGSGPVYYLNLSSISVKDGEEITVSVSKKDFTFTPASQKVKVYNPGYQFINLTANGSYSPYGSTYGSSTTQLTLTFDRAIPNLSVGDITVTGATKGSLSGYGPVYYLSLTDIQVASGQEIKVSLYKPGYLFNPSSKTVVVYRQPIAFSLSANGSDTANTTQLTLTFDRAVTGLTASDITVTGATRGTLGQVTGKPNEYLLNISNITVADRYYVSVRINKSGFDFNPSEDTVQVRVLPTVNFTNIVPNNSGNTSSLTTQLTITLDRDIGTLYSSEISITVPSGRSTNAVNIGTPTRTGTANNQYIIPITFASSSSVSSPIKDGDTLNVKLSKSGYNFSPASRPVTVYNPDMISYTLSQNGSTSYPTSTITITFSAPVAYLYANDISLGGYASTTGTPTPSNNNMTWTVYVTPYTTGNASVSINKSGYSFNNTNKYVYIYAQTVTFTMGQTSMTAGTPLNLTGTVNPSSTSYSYISWQLVSAGTTGAQLSGSTLTATAAGTVSVRATVIGTTGSSLYSQTYSISVSAPVAADKTWLKLAIDNANAALSGVVASADGSDVASGKVWVSQATLNTATQALQAANSVNQNTSATQSQVDSATNALNSIINTLNIEKKTAP